MLKKLLALCAAAFLLGACEIHRPLAEGGRPGDVKLFTVYFDLGSDKVTDSARKTLVEAAAAYKTAGLVRIEATGYTDTVGTPEYNMALSLRRAEAVRTVLGTLGVPSGAIATTGKGEENLAVPTADGVNEPKNRRVEIQMKP